MSVGYAYDPAFLDHDTGNHPESAQRLEAVMHHLQVSGLLAQMVHLPIAPAALQDLARVHAMAMIERVRDLAQAGGGQIDLDTVVSAASYDVARLAAGAAISACEAVLADRVESVYALVRPPGHHATRERPMGFCLFNNVAVAALWALEEAGLSRVAIVDYDVHHGNGTQDIVGADPRVLYISTHQYPYYPGTGHWRDDGIGAGKGSCINVPLPPNTGDHGFFQVYERIVIPALERFQPQLILVSSGYDGHWADPLAWMLLSTEGYCQLARMLLATARALCSGRIVFVLEGGYHLPALAQSVAGTCSVLLGAVCSAELGRSREPEADIQAIVLRVMHWHGLGDAGATAIASQAGGHAR